MSIEFDIEELIDDLRKAAKTAGRTVGKAADKTSQMTGEMIEYTKLKLKISELENKLDAHFESIGRKFYNARTNANEDVPDFAPDFEAVDELKEKIADLKARAEEMKKKKKCENCGKKNDRKAPYCQWCGDRMD